MDTQQQAYINGFVKRASEYGLSQNEAIELLKSADMLPGMGHSTPQMGVGQPAYHPAMGITHPTDPTHFTNNLAGNIGSSLGGIVNAGANHLLGGNAGGMMGNAAGMLGNAAGGIFNVLGGQANR